MKTSPLAPKKTAELPPLDGVRMSTRAAGIKYAGRRDLLMMVFDRPASVAGVFTKSLCASAPVDWCRDCLAGQNRPEARVVVVNAGNANAFTGKRGAEATALTARAAAQACNCEPETVYLASTGVIGEPLDTGTFTHFLDDMVKEAASDAWADAAEAIMTTDTYAKLATRTLNLDGQPVTINGIAKGSGMIAPDMATMLSFVVTDLAVAPHILQQIVSGRVDETFNSITVDSDTSTSDTVLVFATGTSAAKLLDNNDDARLAAFSEALGEVLHDLALQIVRDGEGASKCVAVHVSGAADNGSAKRIAFSIANSPLVKTAIAGEDANWGRIVMAVGKAGEPADRDALAISFGDVRVAVRGERDPDYDEASASAVMRRDEIDINVDVGVGQGMATVWTCDLTKEYVAINGDYRS